jgi:hypothetical protein
VPAARPILIRVADMNLPAPVGSLDGIRALTVAPPFGGTHSRPRLRGRLIHRPWMMIINRMTSSSKDLRTPGASQLMGSDAFH